MTPINFTIIIFIIQDLTLNINIHEILYIFKYILYYLSNDYIFPFKIAKSKTLAKQ